MIRFSASRSFIFWLSRSYFDIRKSALCWCVSKFLATRIQWIYESYLCPKRFLRYVLHVEDLLCISMKIQNNHFMLLIYHRYQYTFFDFGDFSICSNSVVIRFVFNLIPLLSHVESITSPVGLLIFHCFIKVSVYKLRRK